MVDPAANLIMLSIMIKKIWHYDKGDGCNEFDDYDSDDYINEINSRNNIKNKLIIWNIKKKEKKLDQIYFNNELRNFFKKIL